MTSLTHPALTSARDFIAAFASAHSARDTIDGRIRMKRLADNAESEIAVLDAAMALLDAAGATVVPVTYQPEDAA